MKKGKKIVSLFALTFLGGYITSILYVFIIKMSLPPTNLAYDLNFVQFLLDPFVLVILNTVTIVSVLISFPFVYFCLYSKKLSIAAPIIAGSVMLEVIIITPFDALAGLIGTYVVLLVALLFCKFSSKIRNSGNSLLNYKATD